MQGDPKLYIGVAAAVVELAVRQLQSSIPKHRREARAWFLIEPNPQRGFWMSAAGLDEDAVIERLEAMGLLDPEDDDGDKDDDDGNGRP